MVKNGYCGNEAFIFAWDLGVIFLAYQIGRLVALNFFFLNFGLKGVIEKCVGCFLVYLFWGFYLFCRRYYGKRGLNFCVKLIRWVANTLLAPKKELVCVLPFIGKKLSQLRSKLFKSVQNNLSFCYLKVVFQSPYKLHTLFRFKDILDNKICSHLVYRYSCSNCHATYYGKTYQHLFTRAAEYMSISNLTGKLLKIWKSQRFLNNYYNVNAQLILTTLIF